MDDIFNLSGTQSPTHNPFSPEEQPSFGRTFSAAGDVGGPTLPAFSDEDFLTRESLGILPPTALLRDSLTSDFILTKANDPTMSPRESLGILDLSNMDLGRESLGIFNINNPVFKKGLDDKEHLTILCTENNFGGSPFHLAFEKGNSVPQILLSNIETSKFATSSITDFNKGFLYPNSRKMSGLSSRSSTSSWKPSFNSLSLEEISKISCGFFEKPIEPSGMWPTAAPDLFNDAFKLQVTNDMQHSDECKSSSTHYSYDNELENIRNRIHSLPAISTMNFSEAFGLGNITENVSFDEGLLCRGLEEEKDFDDSVFFKDNKQAENDEKAFDNERYFLDMTPQPDWGELDCSKSFEDKNKSPAYNKEVVSKKVDKLLGMQPVTLDEKLKIMDGNRCDSASSVNMSQNLSKISKASQCSLGENHSSGSSNNNFTQDLSKISKTSEENVSKLIKFLAEIIDEKENLSTSQRNEGQHMLDRLANLLNDKNDKSQANTSKSSNIDAKGIPVISITNTNTSHEISASKISPGNISNASGKSSSLSNIGQFRSPQSRISVGSQKLLKKARIGASSKKEPLRAVLPVENMAKDAKTVNKKSLIAVTPERGDADTKLGLTSKKTSTPLQEPKLKPIAASTPSNLKKLNDAKANVSSAVAKPRPARSFSNQPRSSLEGSRISTSRVEGTKFVRRNSVTENTSCQRKESEASPRQKRSFSTGKEPKILSALSRVRQNILNSPYYNPRNSGDDKKPCNSTSDSKLGADLKRCSLELKSLTKSTLPKKLGKENTRPSSFT